MVFCVIVAKQPIVYRGRGDQPQASRPFAKAAYRTGKALFDELFGPKGLRFSMGRTCIGSSDYTTSIYSLDESTEPDPGLKHFSIEHDRAYILPSLRMAREINPDMFLFSAPWSPPAWMKPNRSMLGGSMERTYFDSYAQYFVRFLQSYAAEGVRINATTVQNEVDTNQVSRMPACVWGQEDEERFVAKYLGPAFERASLDTKIWILDHNYDLWGRVLDELSSPEVNRYVDSVAWHAYNGTVDAMTRVCTTPFPISMRNGPKAARSLPARTSRQIGVNGPSPSPAC